MKWADIASPEKFCGPIGADDVVSEEALNLLQTCASVIVAKKEEFLTHYWIFEAADGKRYGYIGTEESLAKWKRGQTQ